MLINIGSYKTEITYKMQNESDLETQKLKKI